MSLPRVCNPALQIPRSNRAVGCGERAAHPYVSHNLLPGGLVLDRMVPTLHTQSCMQYRINNRNDKKKNRQRFGGLRDDVWERDGYRCVDCGMTMDEHIRRWRKRLTVNHINGVGRNSDLPDNRLENLETLCLPCHGAKDGPRWMTQTAA